MHPCAAAVSECVRLTAPLRPEEGAARATTGAATAAGQAARRAAALRLARAAPRCYARTRRGMLCQAPACVGARRCRMHGGRSLRGAAHPRYVHGGATVAARRDRAYVAALVRTAGRTLADLAAGPAP
jgi:hypothetical protein